MLVEAAPAKINLYLRVTGRRDDGYHLLDSLVVFAGARDVLRATAADGLSLRLDGPFAGNLADASDNLVLRAARDLAAQNGRTPSVALHLEKNLPVASGIGGGSADAAACIRLLSRLWRLAPNASLALRLGADVPVCVRCEPRRMRGVGEVLDPAPDLPAFGLALVNPGQALATAAVFRARTGDFSAIAELPENWPDATAMAAGLAALGNDLEGPAASLCPAVGEALSALRGVRGCLLARMSGSGATCFGLFATSDEAERAAMALSRPGWWCWGGKPWRASAPRT